MSNKPALLMAALVCVSHINTAHSGIEFSGMIGFESRWFADSGQFSGQLDGLQNSAMLEPEWLLEKNRYQLAFIPFVRIDGRDNKRTHADIREAYWLYYQNDWELLIGINREFWGVTEARHLVNIVNQIDQAEDIDEEDYLGQPMINLALQKDYGRFSFYLLPLFRERTFAGRPGRLRASLVVDEDRAEYQSGARAWHTDIAFRYAHFIGQWDIGASYFYGTGREPVLLPNANRSVLIPRYDLIHQWGIDIQHTHEAWLWKFEGIIRKGQGSTFAATVAGFEYTWFQFHQADGDLGFLLEHLYDGRNQQNAPASVLENDLFVGMRYTFNDMQDTALLAGSLIDLEDESYSLRLEAERRISASMKMQLEGQWFANAGNNSLTRAFQNDDFIQLTISQFF